MKSREIREMDTEGLNKKLQDLKQELFNLRLRKNVEQLENPKRFRNIRRGIARILTVLREKGSN
ncbi:MAG: 50S ribosomal protein L29 [Desulfurellaceae bacterium]|jgi:large subunit ribosomal protein L29|nr:50S ribosomal protein L29 [Desulfurellaceae bacterium]